MTSQQAGLQLMHNVVLSYYIIRSLIWILSVISTLHTLDQLLPHPKKKDVFLLFLENFGEHNVTNLTKLRTQDQILCFPLLSLHLWQAYMKVVKLGVFLINFSFFQLTLRI